MSLKCDREFYNNLKLSFDNKDNSRDFSFTEKSMRYLKTGWLSQQSLCFEDRKSIELQSVPVYAGVWFSFNLDENIFDKTT